MPNKFWNMETDMIPDTTNAYNLGNASKKWVVNGYNLKDACAKDVTDNTTPTAVTSSDANLITGRTLYNAGYVKATVNGTTLELS